jgi:hypothetical protein
MRIFALIFVVITSLKTAGAAPPLKRQIDLNTERIGVLGLPLTESPDPTYRVTVTGTVGDNDEGNGVLTLDQTPSPPVDEFGFVKEYPAVRELKLDCKLKLVKTTTRKFTVRIGGPGSGEFREEKEEWSLYSVTGPRITSKLFLALPANGDWPGRLLVEGADGKVRHSINMVLPPQPEPCHPGCFPAGTKVSVPGGTMVIERLRVGDSVVTFGADGRATTAKVEAIFVTRNRLLELRTEGGNLTTTITQPMFLEGGEFKAAGELKAGDRVWRWQGAQRRATAALVEVTAPTREAQVFNLVLGAPTTFVADGFLVRSKPPVDIAQP